jgi:hypothetical protein
VLGWYCRLHTSASCSLQTAGCFDTDYIACLLMTGITPDYGTLQSVSTQAAMRPAVGVMRLMPASELLR